MKGSQQTLTIAYLRNLCGFDKKVSGAYLDLRPIVEALMRVVALVQQASMRVIQQASLREVHKQGRGTGGECRVTGRGTGCRGVTGADEGCRTGEVEKVETTVAAQGLTRNDDAFEVGFVHPRVQGRD